jgi:dimeric dUTPase (all-alpha-NTP-PPase superfamily)
MTVTSVAIHTTDNTTEYWQNMYWIDQAAILCVFIAGLYYVLKIKFELQILAIVSVVIVVYMYYVGYITESLCFHKSPDISTATQSIMHIIGSIGHHFIIAGL